MYVFFLITNIVNYITYIYIICNKYLINDTLFKCTY